MWIFGLWGFSVEECVLNRCRNARSWGTEDAWKQGKVHSLPCSFQIQDALQKPEAAGRVLGCSNILTQFLPFLFTHPPLHP